jgi:hypothetical protein
MVQWQAAEVLVQRVVLEQTQVIVAEMAVLLKVAVVAVVGPPLVVLAELKVGLLDAAVELAARQLT